MEEEIRGTGGKMREGLGPTATDPQSHGHRKLVVCIHDVCPATWEPVCQIMSTLRGDLNDMISLAVIPQPNGSDWPVEPGTHAVVKGLTQTPEVLLHGLTHRRSGSWSPMSQLSGGHDEFAGLSADETARHLHDGRAILARLLRRQIEGVLPPAWRAGNINLVYRQAGLSFVVGMSGVYDADRRLPLATWSWDAGPFAALGHLLDVWGTVLSWRTSAIPCLALHPADLRRGVLPRAMRILKHLLRTGHEPTTFGRLLAPHSNV